MDAEEWHMANAVHTAFREGAELAREEHREQKDREKWIADSQAKLAEDYG